MKLKYLLTALFIPLYAISLSAQVPEDATDISPLLTGEKIPEVSVTSTDGEKRSLSSLINQKPAVLLIYRGGWCPYCNTHLVEIREAEQEIRDLGYRIIAISPDSPEMLKKSVNEQKLNYTLYSDAEGDLIKSFGIAFRAPEKYEDMLIKRSKDLNRDILPVPSVFVISKDRTIRFQYINPNYKTRISSNLLIAALKSLNQP